jgi:hypothetical protein
MLNWKQLHQTLESASSQHKALTSKFEEFAKRVDSQVTAAAFHINGMTLSQHLDQGFFTTSFVGRTISFVFTSSLEGGGSMLGIVKCYLQKDHPEPKQIQLGEFTFTASGKTNLKASDEVDTIIINDDRAALYVALHFIHESLYGLGGVAG